MDEKQADKKQSNQERKKGEEVKKQGGTHPMKGQISVKERCREIESVPTDAVLGQFMIKQST